MDERTDGLLRDGRLRDGLLAVVAIGALLDGLRRRGRLCTLRSPSAAVAGVIGVASIEAVLLRHPERTEGLWDRPSVRAASLLGTVAVGRSLARGTRPRMAAALCWGLLAYLLLLGIVLAGRPNPVPSLSIGE